MYQGAFLFGFRRLAQVLGAQTPRKATSKSFDIRVTGQSGSNIDNDGDGDLLAVQTPNLLQSKFSHVVRQRELGIGEPSLAVVCHANFPRMKEILGGSCGCEGVRDFGCTWVWSLEEVLPAWESVCSKQVVSQISGFRVGLQGSDKDMPASWSIRVLLE